MLNYITWKASPYIVDGAISIRWYGLFFALAFFFGYMVMTWVYKREKLNPQEVDRLSIYMLVSIVAGARLGQILFYEPDFYFANPAEMLKIWKGGLASHGAALGIIIAMYLYTRKKPVTSFIWMLDRIVMAVPIGGFLVRMGNLMNSEIYGKETSLPWGFIFVNDPYAGMVPRHPTALYEGLGYLVIFLILRAYFLRHSPNRIRPGALFGIFLMLLFGLRFMVEYLKVVQEEWEVHTLNSIGLNQGQLLSIPFILIGAVFYLRSRRLAPTLPDGRVNPDYLATHP